MLRFYVVGLCAAIALIVPLGAQAEGIYRIPANELFELPGTDITVKLVGVIDQRCGSEVLCVWEGMKRVELGVSKGEAPAQSVILCNSCEDGERRVVLFGHSLTFQDLWPPVEQIEALGRPAVLSDYAVSVILDGQQ